MDKGLQLMPFQREEGFRRLVAEEAVQLREQVFRLRAKWQAVVSHPPIPPLELPFACSEPLEPPKDPEIVLPESTDEVLSLDVFDTCLRRISGVPESVFRMLENWMKLAGKPVEGFAALRREVEEETRRTLQESGKKEDLRLTEIYTALARRTGWSGEEMAQWREAERQLEAGLLVPVIPVRECAGRFTARGGTVIYVSEMYLPSEELADLLRAAGFPVKPGHVHTSGECGLSKGSGNLYKRVREAFPGKPILHIGDNPTTDVEVPRRMGIDAQLFPRREAAYADTLSCLLSSLAQRPRTKAPFWERLGERVLGPLATAWMMQVLRTPGLASTVRLFFLTRDGYFPEIVFRRLAPALQSEVEPVTCFASRRLYSLAAMNTVTADDWEFLLKPAPGFRTADFLHRAGIPLEPFTAALREEGLDPRERVCHHRGFIDPQTKDRLYRVFVKGMAHVYTLRDGLRKRLLAYLDETGLASGGTAILDIGWNGSSLASLERLLGEGAPSTGFFLGLWKNRPTTEPAARRVAFFDQAEDEQLLRGGPALMEFILGSPLGSVVDLHYTGSQWKPLYQEPDVTGAYEKNAYARMEQGLQRFLDAFMEARGHLADGDGKAFLRHRLERLIYAPDAEERRFLGAVAHVEGWGSPYRYRLLPRMERLRDHQAVRLAYAYSGWKGAWRDLEFS